MVLAYENALVMMPLLQALQQECGDDEFVIFRHAFRWLRFEGDFHSGSVLNNCYEMFSLESVLDLTGFECRYSFDHAAIARAGPSTSAFWSSRFQKPAAEPAPSHKTRFLSEEFTNSFAA